MSRRQHRTRSFIVLLLIVFMGGLALNAAGFMGSPLAYSALLLRNSAADEPDFEVVTLEETADSQEEVTTVADYVDFGEFGSVFYNLWIMLTLTVVVIVGARLVAWLIKMRRLGFSSALLMTAIVGYTTSSLVDNAKPATTLEQTPFPVTRSGDRRQHTTVYVDGRHVGEAIETEDDFGEVKVVAVIENGQLVDVLVAEYPDSSQISESLSREALPRLISEAINAQAADVDVVTGATETSYAFIESLETALDKATQEDA